MTLVFVCLAVFVKKCRKNGIAYSDGYDYHIYNVEAVQCPDQRISGIKCNGNQHIEQYARNQQQYVIPEFPSHKDNMPI
jgi:hypothetical protein